MVLFINSIAHLLVDALCAATLFGAVAQSGCMAQALLLYNTLAFSTQCIVGLISDKLKHQTECASASMLLVVLGYLLPLPAILKVCMIGVGNSVFHVSGGAMTLTDSSGRAGKLGVFVAPGCIGLILGTLYPRLGLGFSALLIICALLLPFAVSRQPLTLQYIAPETQKEAKITVPILLVLAVAVRAIGGTVAVFPWKTEAALTILMTLFIFAGKTAGGFICDKLGCVKTALISIPLAAIFIAFFSDNMAMSLAGQLLLNLTMPVTLWLMYKAMPNSPGFAFGLAASALWPGTIVGQLMKLTGPALWICVILSFAFGLFAIVFAIIKMKKEISV